MTTSTSPLLEMQGIVKRYGPTVALNGVDFDVRPGEIHALLGENGAGKSTLMHVLAGLTRPDSGHIALRGRQVHVNSARTARTLGIAMVHQHFALVPAFTVAENLALDSPSPLSGFRKLALSLHYSAVHESQSALERARALGWELPRDARVSDLPVGTQQRVEIVKALATRTSLLIFDEPTAVLSGEEVEELFIVLRRLRDEGQSIVLIAHKLAEILAVADRVTVLRRGNRVASAVVAETNASQLAGWMIGASESVSSQRREEPEVSQREEDCRGPECHADSGATPRTNSSPFSSVQPALAVSDLVVLGDRGEQALQGLCLEVRQGEILGIGGVDGNGQTELAEALVGLRPLQSGSILWAGQEFRPGSSPRTGYIPQDRRRSGLAVSMSVEDNLLFDAVKAPEYRFGPLLKRRALRQLAAELIEKFDIRAPGGSFPVTALSGGNQQKIVVARALHASPELIVAVNPTRGLDIGATRFVHEQLRRAATTGAAVVLISADLDEIAALAHRAAILSGGRLTEHSLEAGHSTEAGLLLGGVTR